MKFPELENALISVGVPVRRYFSEMQDGQYIVWAEVRELESLYADDRKISARWEGWVQYYTRDPDDENVEILEDALNDAGIVFALEDVWRDDDQDGRNISRGRDNSLGSIVYQWTWEGYVGDF